MTAFWIGAVYLFLSLSIVGVFLYLLLLWTDPYVPGLYNSRSSMTDEEFVAACGPGTDPEVALAVRRIVSEKLSIPYDEIRPTDRFIEDLKAD